MELDRELLGSISHELRGPLNGVLGLSSLLLNGTYGPLTDRQRTAVEMIEHSGRNLLGRIDGVVAFVGLLAQPPHPTTTETDLEALATAAIGDPAPANVTIEIAEGTTARIDPTIVGPIIEEVVANAVRNSPSGAPIVISATTDPTVLVVSDAGRGVPPGMEEDVFLPFSQIHGDEGSDERSGLGLARCRILATAHGGTVGLRSGEAGGCVVTLRL
jgi:two-component system sensor histidine kinase KdpD